MPDYRGAGRNAVQSQLHIFVDVNWSAIITTAGSEIFKVRLSLKKYLFFKAISTCCVPDGDISEFLWGDCDAFWSNIKFDPFSKPGCFPHNNNVFVKIKRIWEAVFFNDMGFITCAVLAFTVSTCAWRKKVQFLFWKNVEFHKCNPTYGISIRMSVCCSAVIHFHELSESHSESCQTTFLGWQLLLNEQSPQHLHQLSVE